MMDDHFIIEYDLTDALWLISTSYSLTILSFQYQYRFCPKKNIIYFFLSSNPLVSFIKIFTTHPLQHFHKIFHDKNKISTLSHLSTMIENFLIKINIFLFFLPFFYFSLRGRYFV